MKVITQETESGRWLAWPEDREDIIANGESEKEATDNLNKMVEAVMEYEKSSGQ